ncbi:MAG TPA: YetF domain-containing protein [Gemmataceae bacterium]|jgi:uncharacterized membrane protein YcaP (DUF421 family)|nr:YetF domain-containing protein [Gemmataceae bacterium]
MAGFEAPDWAAIFVPDVSLFESVVRGTVVYFAVLVLMRVLPKRAIGSVGLSDILVLVLISECVSQALNANSPSVVNGVVTVVTLLVWDFALDWAGYRSVWVRKALEHQPVPLVRDGRTIDDKLRAERITKDELLSQLRLNGVEAVGQVKTATLEPDGTVSVVRRPAGEGEPAEAAADFPTALDRFLVAARALRAAVEWHEAQASEHADAAKAARKALSEHGIVGRRFLHDEAEATRNGRG